MNDNRGVGAALRTRRNLKMGALVGSAATFAMLAIPHFSRGQAIGRRFRAI